MLLCCRSYHGTISYLPAQFGLLAAAHVVNMIVDGPMASGYAAIQTTDWETEKRAQAVARKREIKNEQRKRSMQMQAKAHGQSNDSKAVFKAAKASHSRAQPHVSSTRTESGSVSDDVQTRYSYDQAIADQSNAGWGI